MITGSVSGIGKYLAKRFLENGDRVIVTGYHDEHIERTKNELREYKDNTLYFKIDVNDELSLIKMFEIIKDKYGLLDVLINNAAFDQMESIENYKKDIFEKVVSTNLTGKMLCIKHSTNLLKKSEYPTIINIASRLASRPMLNSSAYCCSAAGIIMLTECAALELAKYNIRVNAVSPSLTITPLAKKSYTKEDMIKTAQMNPRNRLCEMKDIYNIINFLISPEADFINGENINVNGGLLLK